jgi:hypothetical protein
MTSHPAPSPEGACQRDGQGDATGLSAAVWRKSLRSTTSNGCVEIAVVGQASRIAIRDSKDPAGPALVVTPATWQSFTAGIRAGTF